MCCNGGDDLLSIAIRAFCDEGRPLAYPVPTYSLYPVLARLQNCRAIEVPFGEKFDLPAGLATTGAALTIVCNPNAPTGSFVPVEEIASLADRLDGVLWSTRLTSILRNRLRLLGRDFDMSSCCVR
jgi:histidinol-phosphate aminotransferase